MKALTCQTHNTVMWDSNPGTGEPKYVCVKCLQEEIAWYRDATATMGYDGPAGDGVNPLKDWLKELDEVRRIVQNWLPSQATLTGLKQLLRRLNELENAGKEMPLCAGHAQSWYTERNHLRGSHDCIVCAFTASLPTDLTIRELQSQLPWTVHYHRDFRASPMAHKDFGHALLHVMKACGKIASVINDAEHGGSEFKAEEVDRYVADLVVCAVPMATTCPGRQIDLQRVVEDRIENKNSVNLER